MIEPTPEQIAEEEEWERSSIQRGIDRIRADYDEANHRAVHAGKGGLVDTEVGGIIVKAVLRPMIDAVKAKQEEAVSAIGSHSRGPFARWWLPILCLNADQWALITVRAALTGLTSELKDSRPTTPLALTISKYGKLQREFDLWRKAEAERTKQSVGKEQLHVDLYKLMVARVKNVNARTAKKWMALSTEADKLEWPKADMVHLGMILLDQLVTHGGGWFRMEMMAGRRGVAYTTERHIILSEEAKQFIRKKQERIELQRPWLAPMICAPMPWRYEDEEEKPHGPSPANDNVPGAGREE